MEKIEDEKIAQVLAVSSEEIVERQCIDISKSNRILEKVKIVNSLSNKSVFIKYGTDERIAVEIMLYNYLLNSKIDKTPKKLDLYHYLAG